MNIQDYTIQRQAELIDQKNRDIDALKQNINDLQKQMKKNADKAEYYDMLVKLVQENTILAADWERFLFLIKLSCDEQQLKEIGAMHG